MFSFEFSEISKNTFFKEHLYLWETASMCTSSQEIIVALSYKASIAVIKSLCLIILIEQIKVFSTLFYSIVRYINVFVEFRA